MIEITRVIGKGFESKSSEIKEIRKRFDYLGYADSNVDFEYLGEVLSLIHI